MNEPLKQRVELSVGNLFVDWLNQLTGSQFKFDCFGADPPDLIYRDGQNILPIEVTTSYYDVQDAKMRWQHARKDPTGPNSWSGMNPDQTLIADINKRIYEKCVGAHDAGTILVVEIYPMLTTKLEFEEMSKNIKVPNTIPFAAIYVAGDFPDSSNCSGGYGCWKVSEC